MANSKDSTPPKPEKGQSDEDEVLRCMLSTPPKPEKKPAKKKKTTK